MFSINFPKINLIMIYATLKLKYLAQKKNIFFLLGPGADLGFSRRRGGADFQKMYESFDTFILVNQIDFPSSPKAQKRPFFGQIFCAAGKFKKKQVKKLFLALFGKF